MSTCCCTQYTYLVVYINFIRMVYNEKWFADGDCLGVFSCTLLRPMVLWRAPCIAHSSLVHPLSLPTSCMQPPVVGGYILTMHNGSTLWDLKNTNMLCVCRLGIFSFQTKTQMVPLHPLIRLLVGSIRNTRHFSYCWHYPRMAALVRCVPMHE